ncbi:unnamed protein product [Sphagnum balticum]
MGEDHKTRIAANIFRAFIVELCGKFGPLKEDAQVPIQIVELGKGKGGEGKVAMDRAISNGRATQSMPKSVRDYIVSSGDEE